ncbi:MAG: GerMN domain-containing protein [Acidimicrobiales bacterium]
MTAADRAAGTRAGRRITRRAAVPAVSLLAAALLAGCGVGVDAAPHVVRNRDVPFTLLRPAPPTTGVPRSGQYVTLYLAGSARLIATSRELPTPVGLHRVLGALGEGPTPVQAAAGLESPISTAAPLSLVSETGTRVTVGVSSSFTKLTEQDQALAIAQLVYTLTVLPGISSVSIRIDGRRAKVPTDGGTLSGAPLRRADYAALGPL